MAVRVLRHTPGTRGSLRSNTAHHLAARHALVHYASGAVFSFIPKNACTSLRVSLARANGVIATQSQSEWVHENNAAFSATLADLARASTTCVILRCPHRRLASVFLTKFVPRRIELEIWQTASGHANDLDTLTFRQFVASLASGTTVQADIHWRPQVVFLAYRDYDRVFSMEDLPRFAKVFEDITGSPYIDARPLSASGMPALKAAKLGPAADMPLADLAAERAGGRMPRGVDLYDDALADAVQGIYADDMREYRTLCGTKGLLFPDTNAEHTV